jgi:hypothetical protein
MRKYCTLYVNLNQFTPWTVRYIHHTLYIATVDILPKPIPDEANQKVILTMLQFQWGKPPSPSLRLDPYRTDPCIDTQRKASIVAHQAVAGLTAV